MAKTRTETTPGSIYTSSIGMARVPSFVDPICSSAIDADYTFYTATTMLEMPKGFSGDLPEGWEMGSNRSRNGSNATVICIQLIVHVLNNQSVLLRHVVLGQCM